MAAVASNLVLVTGGTGLVGSHVIERLRAEQFPVRALVRAPCAAEGLSQWGAELQEGAVADRQSLNRAVQGAAYVVHCAAKVGDWGPYGDYRAVNVDGLKNLLRACRDHAPHLKRFVHISSLGVYAARDHHGTDESEPLSQEGIDGYTRSKIEAERVLEQEVAQGGFPAVILRPGFVYGPRDRTVLPRLLQRLKSGSFAYIGSGLQLLNNTYSGNLADAVHRALTCDHIVGEAFNITDSRLVTRIEFVETICRLARIATPGRHIPLYVAKPLAGLWEWSWRLVGSREAPALSQARLKFLGLHLDFSIDKARHRLGYDPRVDFQQGMEQAIRWAQAAGLIDHPGTTAQVPGDVFRSAADSVARAESAAVDLRSGRRS